MPTEVTTTFPSGLDVQKLLLELEVPFSPNQVQWRVTNTSNDKNRGQVVAYADPRAYTDRLNALFTPQGWTREYKIETMSNLTRVKKGESILSGKVLVSCTVTIFGLGPHSGTGEEWGTMTMESPQRTHKPLRGPAPALVWAATSTMSLQSGSIWTSTGSP